MSHHSKEITITDAMPSEALATAWAAAGSWMETYLDPSEGVAFNAHVLRSSVGYLKNAPKRRRLMASVIAEHQQGDFSRAYKVATVGNVVAGFCFAFPFDAEAYGLEADKEFGTEIGSLYVRRRWQRQGIGTGLIESVQAQNPGNKLYLGTVPERSAVGFYASLGFRALLNSDDDPITAPVPGHGYLTQQLFRRSAAGLSTEDETATI